MSNLAVIDTLILSVAVAVPGRAHSVVFSFVLAGASFAPKQAAGLVNNAGQSFQRLQGSIHCVSHVGTKVNNVNEEYENYFQLILDSKNSLCIANVILV